MSFLEKILTLCWWAVFFCGCFLISLYLWMGCNQLVIFNVNYNPLTTFGSWVVPDRPELLK